MEEFNTQMYCMLEHLHGDQSLYFLTSPNECQIFDGIFISNNRNFFIEITKK